ncbi:nuclear pore complex protein Nup154-like isoform X2 [Ischnura elegans]|uniref:nuclear pore complex protein Nup154-like isoform X2 n=1 Tax=Ischnura elegans TaxID=197161 RepID=UPI001ED87DC8|nr:nuclear pore complex protein Nup154-like isoform X2 [Ischnura elegans]
MTQCEPNQLIKFIEINGVYRALTNGWYWKDIEDDILELKENLRELSKEHDKLHRKYGCWRIQLSILHSWYPTEETFVTAIWDLFLKVENAYIPSDTSSNLKITIMLNEVIATAEACGKGARCFPLHFLVRELEEYCCIYDAHPEKVQSCLISLNLPFRKLFNVYRKLDFFGEDYEDDSEIPSHFLKAFASLIQSFMKRNEYFEMSESDRQSVHQASLQEVESILTKMLEDKSSHNPRLINRYQKLYDSLKHYSCK